METITIQELLNQSGNKDFASIKNPQNIAIKTKKENYLFEKKEKRAKLFVLFKKKKEKYQEGNAILERSLTRV